MNQQIFLSELQRLDASIEHLQKTSNEEIVKKKMEIYRLECELYMMVNLLDGSKKAWKESDRKFDEDWALCPQLDEPLYKDVPGSGGLVLSIRELEKQRLKQEEEEKMKHLAMKEKIEEFHYISSPNLIMLKDFLPLGHLKQWPSPDGIAMISARTSFYLNPAGRGSAKAETEAEFCWRLWILHLQRSPALNLKPNLTTRIGSAVCRNKL
ncbi:hypothetical protein NL676_017370 [Syzygium grande]|nr:hypothetical protein NL676_017370 [Syzygium grande]